MKNLNKNSVANVAKVGVASALIGAGLFLSACGSGDARSKAESLVKQKYSDVKILSYDESKKELGITTEFKKCFSKIPSSFGFLTYVFARTNNEIQVYEVFFPKESDTPTMVNSYGSLDFFKNSVAFKECRD